MFLSRTLYFCQKQWNNRLTVKTLDERSMSKLNLVKRPICQPVKRWKWCNVADCWVFCVDEVVCQLEDWFVELECNRQWPSCLRRWRLTNDRSTIWRLHRPTTTHTRLKCINGYCRAAHWRTGQCETGKWPDVTSCSLLKTTHASSHVWRASTPAHIQFLPALWAIQSVLTRMSCSLRKMLSTKNAAKSVWWHHATDSCKYT